MYATTSTATNTNASCIWPRQARPKQQDCDESDLVTRLQARDDTAFREITERYASKIYRVCYGVSHNRDYADEMAQEVFTKVYFSIRGFEGRSSLYAWIYRIAVNECYGFLRKRRFKVVYSSDSRDDTLTLCMEAIADGHSIPDRTAMQRDLINKLLTVFRKTTVGSWSGKSLRVSLYELSQMNWTEREHNQKSGCTEFVKPRRRGSSLALSTWFDPLCRDGSRPQDVMAEKPDHSSRYRRDYSSISKLKRLLSHSQAALVCRRSQ